MRLRRTGATSLRLRRTGATSLRLRGRVFPAATAVVLVLLAACGKGGAAQTAVRAAPDKTIAAGSAHVTLSLDFSTAGTSGTVTGDGVLDLKDRMGAITLDLGSLGGTFGGVGSVNTVLDSDGIFVKLPSNVIPGSKPWLRLDFASLSQQAGISLGSLGQLRSADPSQALEFLKGAVGDMHTVGTETVRDAKTTHYAGTLDLKKASSNVSADVKPAVDQAISSLGTSKVPADVWLDDQGRVRKLHLQVGGTAQATAPTGTVELELYDFGTPANVQPPPADQVTDLSNIFGSLPHS